MGKGFRGECTSLAGAGCWVLGMLHLHGEEFQMLAGHVFIERKKVKPVIWPPGYMAPSQGGRHGGS